MKGKVLGGIFTILITALLLFVSYEGRISGDPIEAYQVYLHGDKIGIIASSDDLLDLIDNEQSEIKEKYKVDKVYPPNGLDIKKIYTYDDSDLVDVQEIYRTIKDVEPFTIKGYTVKIVYNSVNVFADDSDDIKEEIQIKEPVYIYTMEKDLINKALYNTVYAFLDEDQVKQYEAGTQAQITDKGTIINSIYFDETITIKDDLVSTEEYIFKDVEELSMYLLYGTLEETKTYTVKLGDNLERVAENNKINIKELLIANPDYKTADILLAEGDIINVGYLNPLVSVVCHKTTVEDVSVSYKTTYVDDKSKYVEYQEVTTAGVDGLTRVTQDVKFVNGEIQNVVINNREVLKEPVNKVITRGTKLWNGGNANYNAINSGEWSWPTLIPYVITDHFGYRTLGGGSVHKGIDISGTKYGSPIYSSTEATVIDINNGCPYGYYGSRCGGSYGNYVKVRMDDGTTIMYAHLVKALPKVGDRLSREQLIGYMGSSGSSTGYHLHFEVRDPNGNPIDPCRGIFKC